MAGDPNDSQPNQNSIFRTIYDRVWIAIRCGLMGWDGTQGRKVAVDENGNLQVDVVSGGGITGSTFDDGDSLDTDSQGTLLIGTTDIPGTARAVRVSNVGRVLQNPIVGQDGVDADSGVVGVKTQRVVLATNVPLPAGTNVIGKVRNRDEDTAYLFHATGSASVGAFVWATVASVVISTGEKYRLVMAEGDFSDAAAMADERGIRIQQAGATKAIAHTGANQPNPDIEGLVLENTSGADETWTVQMFNGDALNAETMHGWCTFVKVSD